MKRTFLGPAGTCTWVSLPKNNAHPAGSRTPGFHGLLCLGPISLQVPPNCLPPCPACLRGQKQGKPPLCPNSYERKMSGKVSLATSNSPPSILVTPLFFEDMTWQSPSPQNLEQGVDGHPRTWPRARLRPHRGSCRPSRAALCPSLLVFLAPGAGLCGTAGQHSPPGSAARWTSRNIGHHRRGLRVPMPERDCRVRILNLPLTQHVLT